VFLLPATAAAVTRKLFLRTLEKAWPDRVEAVDDLSVPEERVMPVGAVRISSAPLATPSILHVAIARIPLCGDEAATLFALQFGTDPNVKNTLATHLEQLRPVSDAKATTLCQRIKREAAAR
jgi:hypothetical protein